MGTTLNFRIRIVLEAPELELLKSLCPQRTVINFGIWEDRWAQRNAGVIVGRTLCLYADEHGQNAVPIGYQDVASFMKSILGDPELDLPAPSHRDELFQALEEFYQLALGILDLPPINREIVARSRRPHPKPHGTGIIRRARPA